jgi:hypothetical protein
LALKTAAWGDSSCSSGGRGGESSITHSGLLRFTALLQDVEVLGAKVKEAIQEAEETCAGGKKEQCAAA